MQIKVDKFLALTAMLATAQLAAACVSDDGADTNAEKTDAGLGNADDPSDEHTGEDHADAGNGDPSEEGTITADAGDEVGPVPSDAGDEGDEPTVADAGDESAPSADASTSDAAVTAVDAAVATSDAATTPDAAVEGGPIEDGPDGSLSCGPDGADELFFENCFVFDTCYEAAEGGLLGTQAASTCYNAYYNYRANVADAFWDCYGSAGVEDPCTAESDLAAQNCADASIEGACMEAQTACTTIVDNCAELTADDCNGATAPYNSLYVGYIGDCMAAATTSLGPDFEGCATTFYGCVASPSAE
jgi:hypothetical protein